MARIRSIHPGAPSDEDVATMSWQARLTWAYLPCHADREGRLKDAPFTLKLAILPTDAVDMNAVLEELQSKRHIVRYEVDGRRFIQIRNFARYQTPHVRETESEIPPTPGQALPRQALAMLGTEKAVSSTPDPDPDPSPDVDPDPDEDCSEPPEAASEPVLLVFPCVGKGAKEFGLTRTMVDAWADAWPGIDVLAEAKKALAWVNANPAKRKTAGGMPAFLTRWCNRAQDRSGGARAGPTNGIQRDAAPKYQPLPIRRIPASNP